ncbi:TIGR00255 family protein [Methylobacillus rhizosphaerae]|uniref:TIGR00255 family protein n=1 Tax=Methylobacillus rhizosphaerae TaxID=551994 RepID=A0A238ZGC2_9PROT|nr:YicC/YloC family endoribonuclease [Methylobacillus rhizosphaerae]SNR81773.1 TIGR00255 family protein [Methylobacillus rhizosphaerae]
MIYSMTGYASVEHEVSNGVLVLELRSVNHRYLELQLKLDDNVRIFEPQIRELISTRLKRGKVECRINLAHRAVEQRQVQLDETVLHQLAQMTVSVQRHFPESRPLSVSDILRWPGVVLGESADPEALGSAIRDSLLEAVKQMTEARAREGVKLKTIILDRLAEMEVLVGKVRPVLPEQVKAYQERLTAKLREVFGVADEERIRQELTIFAQRIDVDEELSRLGAHVAEVKRILEVGSPAGKQLDFLMQELNREANTLASKSVSTEVSQAAMTLKLLIEQMREQVQNIE